MSTPLVKRIRDLNRSTTARAAGPRRWIAPFEGDPTYYIFEQEFTADFKQWNPLPLNTPAAPLYPSHYLVSESDVTEISAGQVKWTRTYSRIPKQRIEGESYAWNMPGIATEALYTARAIDNASSFNTGGYTRLTTTTSHGLSVGDAVNIGFDRTTGDVVQGFIVLRRVVSVVNPTTILVPVVLEGADPAFTALQKVDGGRDPVTKTVHSWVQYDYYLPGLPGQPKDFRSIPLLSAVKITDNAGKETNTYSTTTIPTKTTYLADIASGKLIIAEPSTVRRWKGNIFERVTRFVRAE